MSKTNTANTLSSALSDLALKNDSKKQVTIYDLPLELLLNIQKYLSLLDVNSLYQTCTYIRNKLVKVLAQRVFDSNNMEVILTDSCTLSRNMLTNKIYRWGDNDRGVFELGNTENKDSPVLFNPEVFLCEKIEAIYPGLNHAFAKLENGNWYCWGENRCGQLGLGDRDFRAAPVEFNPAVFVGGKIEEFNATQTSAIAKLDSGTWFCWGDNYLGQLGLGDRTSRMVPALFDPVVFADKKIEALCSGLDCFFAKLENGDWYCWGNNYLGQLGLGDRTIRMAPALFDPAVFVGRKIEKLHLGNVYAFAKLEDGAWYCWGDNNFGQLGLGDTDKRITPVRFNPVAFEGHKIEAVYPGRFYTFAKLNDGAWYCWGDNTQGQLGLGEFGPFDDDYRATPARFNPVVFAGRDMEVVYLGSDRVFAKLVDGDCYCWGSNFNGQLGLGDDRSFGSGFVYDFFYSYEPVKHPFLSSNAAKLKEIALAEKPSEFGKALRLKLGV